MARRYWVQVNGKKLYRDTLGAVQRIAQDTADRIGRAVQVGYDDVPSSKTKTMRRNPDPGAFLDYWQESEAARRRRLDYLAATKATRLAKGLRGRGKTATAEAAHEKTGKFAVDVRNARESYTLYRPSRSAAEAVGGDFRAAGYKVTIRPV